MVGQQQEIFKKFVPCADRNAGVQRSHIGAKGTSTRILSLGLCKWYVASAFLFSKHRDGVVLTISFDFFHRAIQSNICPLQTRRYLSVYVPGYWEVQQGWICAIDPSGRTKSLRPLLATDGL